MDAATFLDLLFGEVVGPDAQICIWTLPDKAARFLVDCTEASTLIGNVDQNTYGGSSRNVYFGCALYRAGITSGRGKAADVVGLVALWADVDYGPDPLTGKPRKKNTPPDLQAASHIIDRLEVPPSLIVHSGHGLQPWWLFKEFLPVADGAAQLSERWGVTVQAVAHAAGYAVDSVWDLARVLRPPGTMNRKAEPFQKVTAVPSDPLLRYEPDDLKLMCWVPSKTLYGEPVFAEPGTGPNFVLSTLDLQPGRKLTVNLNQIEQLAAIDARLKATWDGKRKDLPDGSPSSYDMALAHFGALVEWSDQQIADLIFLWRTVRGLNPQKANRRDYIQETIRKARKRQEEERTAEKIAEPVTAEETPAADDPEDARRKPILERLNKTLGIPIARWIQFGDGGADYTLILSDGRKIAIGPVANVSSQRKFNDKVYEVRRIMPPMLKARAWKGVCDNLGAIAEVVENPEGAREYEVCAWIRSMMEAGSGKHVQTNVNEAIEKQALLRRDGRLHVLRDKLHQHVTCSLGRKLVTVRQIEQALAAAGFKSTPVRPTTDGRSRVKSRLKTRRFWRDDAEHFGVADNGETTCVP